MIVLGAVLSAYAGAPTAAVSTDVGRGPMSEAAVQSVIWHSLSRTHGHTALLVDPDTAPVLDTMQGQHLDKLYHFEIRWAVRFEQADAAHMVAGWEPLVRLLEYDLTPEGVLLKADDDAAVQSPALYPVGGDFVDLPEVALEGAVDQVMGVVGPPSIWGVRTETLRVPIIVAADPAYRHAHEDWRREAGARVAHASAILSQAGIELDVVAWQDWNPSSTSDLSVLLDDLAAAERPANGVRIGFTWQDISWLDEVQDVGRAFLPGDDVVVADQPRPPEHERDWDVTEEGIAVAHEVAHALGAPHLRQKYFLMSENKGSIVHVMAPSTRRILRTAVQARYVHWDPARALLALSQRADELDEPTLQLDYIRDNLLAGPGFPDPERVRPERLPALANLAMERHYLELADSSVHFADAETLRNRAAAHHSAALAGRPAASGRRIVGSADVEAQTVTCPDHTVWCVEP